MMDGISFDNIHSQADLNMVLSKVEIPPATVKTTFVDIPGGDGSMDLTESLGKIRYKDRECKFTFSVLPTEDFEEKKTEVSNLLNGRRCKIILDKDPDYFWNGRCTINAYESNKKVRKIVVGATVSPYKMKTAQTVVMVPAGDKVTAALMNSRKSVVPTIIAAESVTIEKDGDTFELSAGTHRLLNLELVSGRNIITVTSKAPVKFTYQEGDL